MTPNLPKAGKAKAKTVGQRPKAAKEARKMARNPPRSWTEWRLVCKHPGYKPAWYQAEDNRASAAVMRQFMANPNDWRVARVKCTEVTTPRRK